jgi:putative membrane protein
MMHPYGWDHMDRVGWFATTLMFVLALFVLLAIVYIVMRFLSESRTRGTRASDQDHAVTILRERYARGEIDADEYDRARERLEHSGRTPAAPSR